MVAAAGLAARDTDDPGQFVPHGGVRAGAVRGPGELSPVGHGVLLLDDLELTRRVLETLRQPIEIAPCTSRAPTRLRCVQRASCSPGR